MPRLLPVALAVAVCLIGLAVAAPDDASALRKATPQERAMVIRSTEFLHNDPRRVCRTVGVMVRVSTVNTRYARLNFNNRVRDARRCSVGDGFRVMRRVAGTRRYVHIADYSWTGAPCWKIPRRVALDLVADAARDDPWMRRCDR